MPRDAPLLHPADIAEALALLTRLPVPAHTQRAASAAWAWPLAGLVIALVAGLIGLQAVRWGLPPGPAAALVLAAQIAITGALHEDGLADTADGFWGGHERARRLEIMKDSRIGCYGVLALGLSLLARWSALVVLIEAGWLLAPLLATAALSRAPMAALITGLANARGSGLAAGVGRPVARTTLLAIGIALVAAFMLLGWSLLAPVLAVSLVTLGMAALARAKIGGQTGDVLGAVQQASEIAALFTLAASV